MAERALGLPPRRVAVTAAGRAGPVEGALCTARAGAEVLGSGFTDADGELVFDLAPVEASLKVESYGRPTRTVQIAAEGAVELSVDLAEPAWIEGVFTDEEGEPLPCAIQIVGRLGTRTPDFFPGTGEWRVRGTIHTLDGRFRQALRPGLYTAIASRGPEYDIATVEFQARRGGTTRISGRLVRSVDTSGWIAADLHGHSSPSGDTYASPLGRLLSLVCTGIEFSPRTEHDRIESFDDLIAVHGLRRWLASAPGIELTGDLLRVGHNIAFPLVPVPHTQGGGAPPVGVESLQGIRPSTSQPVSVRRVAVRQPKSRADFQRS